MPWTVVLVVIGIAVGVGLVLLWGKGMNGVGFGPDHDPSARDDEDDTADRQA